MTDIHEQPIGNQEAQGESVQVENVKHISYLQKYNKLLSDDDFDRIELGLKEANIFTILGIQRMEIRHSNFLAWMFDPSGSHGMGNLFLHRFLRDISLKSSLEGQNLIEISVTSPKTAEIRREWRNIDLLVILEGHVVCIENKVDSSDHENQLSKYKDVITREFPSRDPVFVYLTPDGRSPNDESQHAHYINYSYEKIVEHTDRLLRLRGRSLPANVKTYIEDYTRNIRRNLMKQDPLNKLAHQLYANHKEVLDFIFDNRPDVVSQVKDYFSNKIKDQGYTEGSRSKRFVRFTTNELDSLLLKKGDGFGGWDKKEQFLFEFEFRVKTSNKLFVLLRTSVHPSGDQEIRRILIEAIGSPPVRVPSGSRFSALTKREFIVLNNIAEGVDDNLIKELFDREWARIIEIVSDVSRSILERSDVIRSIYHSSSLADNKSVS